jgi:hypothetical protein
MNVASITAIIPLIAREVAKDWGYTVHCLKGTLDSILALPESFIQVMIVGHDFPSSLSETQRVQFLQVDHPLPEKRTLAEKMHDKGLKIMAGVRHAHSFESRWVMFCDADDLISRKLHSYCNLDDYDAICIERGWAWKPGSSRITRLNHFYHICGTSWIMRCNSQLFPTWLGTANGRERVCDIAHTLRLERLAQIGARVQMVKQRAVIYMIEHAANNSWGEGLMSTGISEANRRLRVIIADWLRSERLKDRTMEEFTIVANWRRSLSPDQFITPE